MPPTTRYTPCVSAPAQHTPGGKLLGCPHPRHPVSLRKPRKSPHTRGRRKPEQCSRTAAHANTLQGGYCGSAGSTQGNPQEPPSLGIARVSSVLKAMQTEGVVAGANIKCVPEAACHAAVQATVDVFARLWTQQCTRRVAKIRDWDRVLGREKLGL
jgi:hypothetical protein